MNRKEKVPKSPLELTIKHIKTECNQQLKNDFAKGSEMNLLSSYWICVLSVITKYDCVIKQPFMSEKWSLAVVIF